LEVNLHFWKGFCLDLIPVSTDIKPISIVAKQISKSEIPARGWLHREWAAYGILLLTFLPLTIPNWWEGGWRCSLWQGALWLAFFGSRWWAVLVLVPFYLLTPVLVFVATHYGPPNLNLLGGVRFSLASEQEAFLAGIPGAFFLLYLLLLIPLLAAWHFSRVARKRTPIKVRVVLIFVCCVVLVNWAFRARHLHQPYFREIVAMRIGSYQPMGLPISMALTALDADGARQAIIDRERFDWKASAASKLDNVIFVIGESSRADHWSLNGYARPTNPDLSVVSNLLSFSKVVSLAPNTMLAWPFLLTLKEPGDSLRWPNTKSFISAFQEAGYTTRFVSFYMDQNFSSRDPLSLIAFDAQAVIKGIKDTDQKWKRTDLDMLPTIRSLIAEKQSKLIVISTQGSHPGFENFCPPEFNVFQPSNLTEKETPETYRNGYDNSILATDRFLYSLIGMLRDSRSILFYVSDHGLAVYDHDSTLRAQAYVQAEYRPACMVWASDQFLADAGNRQRFDLGRQHLSATATSDYMLHSLFDLCGVNSPLQDPAKSLFNAAFMPPKTCRVEDFYGRWHDLATVPFPIDDGAVQSTNR
jgi:glucan phosphoethanolaminetransferase (alkaline phosphatase superfamily)